MPKNNQNNSQNLLKNNQVSIDIPDKSDKEVLESIKELYHKGLQRYEQGQLEAAEKLLTEALKPILSKPKMKLLTSDNIPEVKEELLDSIYHLGLIYLNEGSSYREKNAKAGAIFQYCARFTEKYQITLNRDNLTIDKEFFLARAYETEQKFLTSIGIKNTNSIGDIKSKTESYRQELKNIRLITKQKLEEIESLKIVDIAKRAEAIKNIYQECNKFFVHPEQDQKNGFVQKLIADCYQQLGNPPEGCKHAIVGLGSLSMGTMTPWSDLEFAILINESKEEFKKYFEDLSMLLKVKITNLGETILPTMGIESLNNYKTADEKDEWFWDDIGQRGFSFDGSNWEACKSPLGRRGYKALKKIKNKGGREEIIFEEKPDYELILTPAQMAKFQEEESWFNSDKHLVQALRSVYLIDGSQAILDDYIKKLREEKEGTKMQQQMALQLLNEDLEKFSLKLGDEEDGKLINVKKDIYRVTDRIIVSLTNYYGISADLGQPGVTIWQLLDKMLEQKILSDKGARHLKEALAIAIELRLNTYYNNFGQKETMSTYIPATGHLTEEQRALLLEKTFYLQDIDILKHFYYVMIRVQNLASGFCSQELIELSQLILNNDELLENSNYTKAMVHARFLEYDKATQLMQIAKEERPGDLQILNDLFSLYKKTGLIEKDLVFTSELIASIERNYDKNLNSPDIIVVYNNFADSCYVSGLYNEAIEYCNKALEICKKVYDDPNHHKLSIVYNNLGAIYFNKAEYSKAITCYDKALKIYKIIYEHNLNHLDIAKSYHNLGSVYSNIAYYDQAINYYNMGLKIELKNYEQNPNHPDIAKSYHNLGVVYSQYGKYDQGIKFFNYALKIQKVIYETMPNHPEIATTYNSFGSFYEKQGEYNEALKWCHKALNMKLKIYQINPNHPEIAHSYNSLGILHGMIEDYNQAIKNFNKALEIYNAAYKRNLTHPHIANSYHNLGKIFEDKMAYQDALEYYTQALNIRQKVYTTNSNHPHLAQSYKSLGIIYSKMQRYDDAINNHDKALKIMLIAYGSASYHPDISGAYDCLGTVCWKKEEYDQALRYYNQALDIRLKAYTTNSNHPHLAQSYDNLALVYSKKQKFDKAIENLKNALTIYEVIYKDNLAHYQIGHSYSDLGMNYGQKGEYELADQYFKKAYEVYKIAHKNNCSHPDIKKVLDNLKVNEEFTKIGTRIKNAEAQLPDKNKCGKVKIDISDLKKDYLKIYCASDLRIDPESLVFKNNFCLIDLNKTNQVKEKANISKSPNNSNLHNTKFDKGQQVNQNKQKVDELIKESFKKAKLKPNCTDAEIEIKISGINPGDVQSYCKSQLSLNSSGLTFFNNSCYISFDNKAIEIMRNLIAIENPEFMNQEMHSIGEGSIINFV